MLVSRCSDMYTFTMMPKRHIDPFASSLTFDSVGVPCTPSTGIGRLSFSGPYTMSRSAPPMAHTFAPPSSMIRRHERPPLPHFEPTVKMSTGSSDSDELECSEYDLHWG